jgi:5-methylcytosine-specific restriction protein A
MTLPAYVQGKNRKWNRFYNSKAWHKLRAYKLAISPLCQLCLQTGRVEPAIDCHHMLNINEHPEYALDITMLLSLCKSCHGDIEAAEREGKDASEDVIAELLQTHTPGGAG